MLESEDTAVSLVERGVAGAVVGASLGRGVGLTLEGEVGAGVV